MRFEHEAAPLDVNERVALAPVDLFARIVTAWPARLSGLDALAVDDFQPAGAAKRKCQPFSANVRYWEKRT